MRIAITGGIAEGKSTILEWLREDGWPVCSSDVIARQLFADPDVNRELSGVVGLEPPLQPSALRAAILGSHSVRRAVNRFLHPLIGELSRASNATFFEVPLLIEACLQQTYDQVWVVSCGREEQRARLMARYGDEALINELLATQLPPSARIPFADRVFRTNEPLETVRSSLYEATRELSR